MVAAETLTLIRGGGSIEEVHGRHLPANFCDIDPEFLSVNLRLEVVFTAHIEIELYGK